MILDALISFWSSTVIRLMGMIPPVPAGIVTFVGDFVGSIQIILDRAGLFGSIIPFGTLAVCWAVLWIAIGFGLVVEVARIVFSYFTFGGGSQ